MGLNCQDCRESQRDDRGCERDSIIKNRWEIEKEYYQRCPLKIISGVSFDYIHAYRFFKMGYLPNGKGWLDETKKFLQAMNVIDLHSQKGKDDARQ